MYREGDEVTVTGPPGTVRGTVLHAIPAPDFDHFPVIDYAPDPDLVREILKEESVDLILLIEHQHGDEDVAFFALHKPERMARPSRPTTSNRANMSDDFSDPRYVPDPDSPAWLAALGEADQDAEQYLEQQDGKSLLTGAICPHCKLHRGHRHGCPLEFERFDKERPLTLEAYHAFLKAKVLLAEDQGFVIEDSEIHPSLKPHQRVAVRWACRGGRRALFESFGLGKTRQQLEILRLILKRTGGRGLIVAPLGVRQEFERDAEALGIEMKFIRSIEECGETGIYVTNYETVRDGRLNPAKFTVASLDEAAILAGFGGVKTFREFMRLFEPVRYRFVATATPDPNEYIELLAFAAFLGIMEVSQAKTRWF